MVSAVRVVSSRPESHEPSVYNHFPSPRRWPRCRWCRVQRSQKPSVFVSVAREGETERSPRRGSRNVRIALRAPAANALAMKHSAGARRARDAPAAAVGAPGPRRRHRQGLPRHAGAGPLAAGVARCRLMGPDFPSGGGRKIARGLGFSCSPLGTATAKTFIGQKLCREADPDSGGEALELTALNSGHAPRNRPRTGCPAGRRAPPPAIAPHRSSRAEPDSAGFPGARRKQC